MNKDYKNMSSTVMIRLKDRGLFKISPIISTFFENFNQFDVTNDGSNLSPSNSLPFNSYTASSASL